MGSDVGSHVCVGRVTVVSMWGSDVGSHVCVGRVTVVSMCGE